MKIIYGRTITQAQDFVKKNREMLDANGGFTILLNNDQLRGMPRDGSVEIIAVGDWKFRKGSGSMVSEAKNRNIKILTKDGYYERFRE